MLREELLRSKQDEIARCLLSRKRKLSELYFATVGYAGATDTFADSAYQEKEQSFLDANDITKGRWFNEATLPPLPIYPEPAARETKPAPSSLPAPIPATSNVVSASPLSRGEASAPEAASQGAPELEAQKAAAPQLTEKQLSRPGTQPHDSKPSPLLALGASEGSQKLDGLAAKANLQQGQKGVSLPETPRSSQDSIDGLPRADEKDTIKAVSPGESAITTPKTHHDLHESPLPGRPVHVVEQPLSPVSSAGPYSNNTPAPTAGSPATSATEEAAEPAEKPPTPKPTATVQGQSSFVPTTPDEQLRFEEAQSLQQNALLVSQVKDGAGAGPLANQVISEDLPSTFTATKATEDAPESVPEGSLPDTKKTDSTSDAIAEPEAQAQPTPVQDVTQAEVSARETAPAPQPTKKASPPVQPAPPLERMTTRVSSGAIRHKSVSEILGEAPKTPVSPVEKLHAAEKPNDLSRAGAGNYADSAKLRLKDRKAREKERSKHSTVVFPKQQQQDKGAAMDLVRQQSGDLVRLNEEQDYLFTLFQNKAYAPPRSTTLSALLSSAHKTLSTNNYLIDYQEQVDCRILRRIYDLQHANKWPLRQLKRSAEPPRQGSHWDVLLDHMKWMRTDYREERKWKLAAAKSCADWCAEYIYSDPESRSMLRVQAKIPPKESQKKDEPHTTAMVSPPADLGHDAMELSLPTPDLVPSNEEDSVSEGFVDEPRPDIHDTVAPAAIFSLGSDEFTFSLDMTPAAQKLLDELPIYTPVQIAPDTHLPTFKEPPDMPWKTELLPVSKYARGKIMFHKDEPARKRSRYDYSQYDSGSEHLVLDLTPEQTNVALFQPENRHIRDRIHPAQPFRPPTEYPMPSLGFLESRQSSQWTYAEDEELRSLVEEYSYNWSLISSCLTPPSQFTSGAERRTPWECFERWAGIEGLPSDMSKTPYFRAYHQRIDTAQRNVMAQQAAAQQQQQQQQQQGNASGNQPPMPLIRRRGTQPIRVDRRRSSKHLALLDAMRKLAKKRETILQKQQHASQLASLRKVNEANQPKPPISSPAEFSRLKHERELKLQERQEQYRQQMIAQQRASLAARAGQMPNQQQMMNAPGRGLNPMPHNPSAPSVATSTPNGLPNGMPNPLANMPNGVPQGVGVNQARPHVQGMQGTGGVVNNQMPPNPMAMKMMPQAGMQQNNGARPNMPMQASPDNARVIREANRLQEQQRLLQSRQQPPQHSLQQQQAPQQQNQQQQLPQQSQQAQQQFHAQPQFVPQGSNSPNLNMPTVNGTPNNPAMMAALQAGGGMQSPPFHNTTPQGVSTPSPRMGQPNPLSGGAVPTTISAIQNQIQKGNPNMPMDQVRQLATEQLHRYSQQQRMSQVAMNAAAGNLGVQPNYQIPHDGNFQPPQTGMNGAPNMQVSQAQGFSPMMRVSQPAQQNRVGSGSSPAMGVAVPQQSRSATPQTQRSGSIQTGPISGASKSPNHPQTQSMGA